MFATESSRQVRAFEYGMAIIASDCEWNHKLQFFPMNSLPIMTCHLAYEVANQPIHVALTDLLLCLGLLRTWDWGPMTIALQALSLVEKAEPVQVRFTLRLRDQRSKWMWDGCEVYMDSFTVSNGTCFMVTLTILKDHLVEVGLTQNREIEISQLLIYYILLCMRTLHVWKFVGRAFGWGPGHIWLHTTLEGPWSHCMILEVSWDGLWTLLLGSHNFMVATLGSCVKLPLVQHHFGVSDKSCSLV